MNMKTQRDAQSLVFPKRRYTRAEAIAWARSHGFRYAKVDDAPRSWRIRQVDPRRFTRFASKKLGKSGIVLVLGWAPRRRRRRS